METEKKRIKRNIRERVDEKRKEKDCVSDNEGKSGTKRKMGGG